MTECGLYELVVSGLRMTAAREDFLTIALFDTFCSRILLLPLLLLLLLSPPATTAIKCSKIGGVCMAKKGVTINYWPGSLIYHKSFAACLLRRRGEIQKMPRAVPGAGEATLL